jgi:hypothetical protein
VKVNRNTSPRYVAPRRRVSDYQRLEARAAAQERFAWTLVVSITALVTLAILRAVGV